MSLTTNIKRIVIVPGQRASGLDFEVTDGTTSARQRAQVELSQATLDAVLSEAIAELGAATAEVVDAKPQAVATALHQMREAKKATEVAVQEADEAHARAELASARERAAAEQLAVLEAEIATRTANLERLRSVVEAEPEAGTVE